MPEVNPFLMTELELTRWMEQQEAELQQIKMILTKCQYIGHIIPTLWRVDRNTFYIVSQSAKRENTIQLTCFVNNTPTYDILRSNISDIASELQYNNATIEQINYIN